MIRPDLIPVFAVAFVTLAAAATDLWRFKVYNVLTFPALFTGLVVSTALGGFGGLTSSLLGAAVGFGTLVFFFALGGVGAGDLKLMTAIGAWLGPYLTFHVFVAAALAAGAYALVLVVLQGGLLAAVAEVTVLGHRMLTPGGWVRPEAPIEAEVRRSDRRRRLVPFAAMTCVGFFVTFFWWFADLHEVWPPYHRPAATATATATASAPNPGGLR